MGVGGKEAGRDDDEYELGRVDGDVLIEGRVDGWGEEGGRDGGRGSGERLVGTIGGIIPFDSIVYPCKACADCSWLELGPEEGGRTVNSAAAGMAVNEGVKVCDCATLAEGRCR